MTPEEIQELVAAARKLQSAGGFANIGWEKSVTRAYSLAEVQLTNGEVFAMMITAEPTLGPHLTKEMASTGYLYLYNDTESLIVKADRIAAVKLTKMTSEGA